MKKTFALLLALVMIFSLAACGGSPVAVDKDAVGMYYCVEAERSRGINWPDGERLELKEDGTCVFYEGESSGWETPGKWTLDGSDLTLRFYGEKYEADLSGGELELEGYNGASYLFSDDEDDIPDEADRPVETPATPAPGNTGEADFDIGYYTGSYGVTYSSEPMKGEYVELYDDLTGMIRTTAGTEYFEWYMQDDTIYLYMDSGEYVGSNDGFVLEFTYRGTDYTFEWDTEPQYDSDEEHIVGISAEYWNRDWYGWWFIEDGYGEWADATGNWWDCCATIRVDADGSSTIELWDEDFDRYDLMACAEGQLYDYDDGDMGYLLMESGYFMDGSVDYWDVDPSYSDYEEMLAIEGYYEDPDNSENYFYYTIYLRPWGYIWSDVETDSPEDLPYYYYDWYLPAIEEDRPMPDVIG